MNESKLQEGISHQFNRIGFEYRKIASNLRLSSASWMQRLATYSSKSVERSLILRKNGDQFREHGNIEDALSSYNNSIAVAPPDTIEVLLAIANRSAILFEMKNYVGCLLDINRVLKFNFSEKLRRELLDRKEQCMIEIGKINEIKSKILAGYIKTKPLLDTASGVIMRKLKPTVINGDEIEANDDEEIPVFEFQNEFIPNASAKIKLQWDSQYGRHITAQKDIEAGEVIVSENPFTWFLNDDRNKKNCSYCLKKNDAMIACNGCSFVMYCGESCRDKAYDLYHQTECKIIGPWRKIVKFNHFDCLALRIMLIGLKQGRNLRESMNNPELQNIFISEKRKWVNENFQGDYIRVCNLERCPGGLNEVVHCDIIQKCAYFLYSLKCASFFGDSVRSSSNWTEEQRFVALHLLNSFYVAMCNPYAVGEITLKKDDNAKVSTTIGIGLYPFLSLVNHSCDPNCSYYFVKNRVVFYTNRPVVTGEQIFTSYGPLFSTTKLEQRRFRLKQYNFQCECRACRMNWPILEDIPETTKLLSNRNSFATQEQMRILKKEAIEIMSNLTNLNVVEELLDFHRKFSKIIQDNFVKPSIWFLSSGNDIEKLMEMNGNLYLGTNNIVKIIEIFIRHALDADIQQWFSAVE